MLGLELSITMHVSGYWTLKIKPPNNLHTKNNQKTPNYIVFYVVFINQIGEEVRN